ncbi:MAG TPA: multidrug efflux SMR transporter [Rhizomicrobium sp.]|nr:multidrug efflux SMR transporter [Rhizomicrobium sp.]
MSWLYLAGAILAEVIATSFLKQSEGFTQTWPTLICTIGYGTAFWLLSLALKTIPTGMAYAAWSGLGTVLIVLVAWLWQGQKLDAPALAGIGLIVSGVAVMNLFSRTVAH